jgi:hypothetical protein
MIRRSIITLGSAVALVLTASAPTHAAPVQASVVQPSAVYNTNITTNAKPEPIAKNKKITITGTFKYNRNGTIGPMANARLAVHFDPAGSDRSRWVATIKTDRNGSYSHKVTASRSGKWTVKYTSSNGTYKSDSAADAVCVYSTGRWQCPVAPNNPDLDCPQIGRTVWVGNADYHRLDADNDGWGCDSYS